MRILCWTQTDVGQKRDHNEDSFLVAADVGLYVVADGMGGHAGGDQASQMAVSSLHDAVRQAKLAESAPGAVLGDEPHALTVLRAGARAAGEIIFDLAQQNARLSGMGTTLTALLFNSGRVHLAHVGDSRAYLFRDGRIEQLSEDHSWINEQVKAGLITDEEAKHSKFKHIITRSVGFEREVSVDVMSLPVLMGDCYLICSDGLSNYLETDEIGRLLTTGYYARVPSLLVDLANERGGDDNITVVLVYVANDSGQPVVEDLSRPDPCRATTHPGPDPTLSQSNARDMTAPEADKAPTAEKAASLETGQSKDGATEPAQAKDAKPEAPKPEAPKPEAPKPEAPKPEAPKPEAPKPEAPKPEAPKPEASEPEDGEPIEAPPTKTASPKEPSVPAAKVPATSAPPGALGAPTAAIDPDADTAPAEIPGAGKASKPLPPSSEAAPNVLANEPTPEAGLPSAPKTEDPA